MYRRTSESPLCKTKNRSQNAEIDRSKSPMRAHTVHNEDKLRVTGV